MTGNEVVPIQCDIRDATAVSSAIDSCVEKVNCSKNVINNLQSVFRSCAEDATLFNFDNIIGWLT